jgi:anti-sigma regulatory factor (Ser/Thr protein kinase)
VTTHRTFDPVAKSVPEVRRFVLGCLEDLPQHQLDVVGLLVSELATNAVIYAGTPFSVDVWCGDDGVVVTVADDGRGTPEVRAVPEPTDPHGRGLLIVSQLADEWGVDPSFTGQGKTVWFRLDPVRGGSGPQRPAAPGDRSGDDALVS